MKTLNIIQTLSKIGRVLSKISYIFCLIGAIGSALGLVSLPFADRGIFKIGGVSIYGLIVNTAGIDLISLYPALTGAMILCIGQMVLSQKAEHYFAHELAAGTPFTQDGAREMRHLGILTICLPLSCLILAEIVSGIMVGLLHCEDLLRIEAGGSVTLGVMLIVTSLLCRHGAELGGDSAAENAEK